MTMGESIKTWLVFWMPILWGAMYFFGSGWLTAVDMRFYTKWEPDKLPLWRRLWFIVNNAFQLMWQPMLVIVIGTRVMPATWYEYGARAYLAAADTIAGGVMMFGGFIVGLAFIIIGCGKGAIYIGQTIFGWPQRVEIITRRNSPMH